jgi:hypothetical protein
MIAAEHLALLAFATTRKRAGRRCCNMASRCARERGLSAIGQERMRRRRIAKVAGGLARAATACAFSSVPPAERGCLFGEGQRCEIDPFSGRALCCVRHEPVAQPVEQLTFNLMMPVFGGSLVRSDRA